MKIVFLFIDGVGLRQPAPDNPLNSEVCPVLCRLIARHSKPIDACLGVEGLPQSATGQSTMFTGVNTPAFMGRHCEGFPGPGLRDLISRNNIFLELKKKNLRFKFADAYLIDSPAELAGKRFKSVTTVMALSAPESISIEADLLDGNAVMQDLTREVLQDRRPDIPCISPADAANHLFSIARGYDFTLFEYFQTDVAGHSMDYERACDVLRRYDAFLGTLLRLADAASMTIVMTADHGNIEAMNERGHTRNPVPFIVCGPHETSIRKKVNSLVDVMPAVLSEYFGAENAEPQADNVY